MTDVEGRKEALERLIFEQFAQNMLPVVEKLAEIRQTQEPQPWSEMIFDLFEDIRNMPESSADVEASLFFWIMKNVRPDRVTGFWDCFKVWKGVAMAVRILFDPEVAAMFGRLEAKPYIQRGQVQGRFYNWEDLRRILLAVELCRGAGGRVDLLGTYEAHRDGCGEEKPPVRLKHVKDGVVFSDPSGLV